MISILLAALWVGPAMSGSWYTPERNGEGFTLQVLENGTAHALWFTYPPVGSAAQQAWIYASGGRIDGDRIRFEGAFTTRGPRFGAGYDPAALQVIPWGTIEFTFTGCNDAELTYAGPAAWGSGARRVTRLTALAELECSGKRRLNDQGSRTLAGLRSRSGAWYDPAHNGEGWNVEELPDGRAQVYWFTYDASGEQAWTIGVAPASGSSVTVSDNFRPVGARFGPAFDPAQVQPAPWGQLELQLASCMQGTVNYQSLQSAFGSGTLAPVRLTIPAAAPCIDGTPAAPATASWGTGVPMPQPSSESATASVDGLAYVAGGFGDERGFNRYDVDRNAWTALRDLPGGRDHPLAVAVGGEVYVTGGNPNGGGDHASPGWRYVAAEDRWEDLPQLPVVRQAGAAALAGFAYFGDIGGNLWQFNPVTRATRLIPGDDRAARDHSQIVAFQGELWLIGGRGFSAPTTARVSIYDPASETWRVGPQLATARAGFAAAASASMLIVAGGEVITSAPNRTLGSVEAIAAGQAQWSALPSLPTAVHGMGGLIRGNSFLTLGGSTLAGGVDNPGVVQILRW